MFVWFTSYILCIMLYNMIQWAFVFFGATVRVIFCFSIFMICILGNFSEESKEFPIESVPLDIDFLSFDNSFFWFVKFFGHILVSCLNSVILFTHASGISIMFLYI